MFVLYDFLLLILFSILFMGAYFSIERLITAKVLRKLFVGNVFARVFEGAVYGLVILLLELLMTAIYTKTGIAFYFISFLVMISMKKIRVASYALVPSMLYMFFSGEITSNTFMLVSLIFVFAALTIILEFSIKKFNYGLVLYPIMFAFAFIALLISVYVFNRASEENIGYIFYTIIGSILVQFIATYSLKTSASANVLHRSVNFSHSTFYRASFVEEVVGAYLKDTNLEIALYGLFKMNIQEKWDKSIKKEIIETILENIKESFPENAILFHIEGDKYGFFLPWESQIRIDDVIKENTFDKRSSTSSMIPLTLLLNKASKNIRLSSGEEIKTKIKAGVSIYGIQSNSLSELHRNASFASQYIAKEKVNQFNVFDPREYSDRVKDVKNLKELEDLIELNDIELNVVPLFNKESNIEANIIVPRQKSDDGYVGTFFEYVESAGKTGIFNRFIAAESMKNKFVSKEKIIITHDWKYFGTPFDIEMFINKFNIMNITIEQVVLNFDESTLDADAKTINNIKQLKQNGFGISITFSKEETDNRKFDFSIDYIFTNDINKTSNNSGALVCNINIKDEQSLLISYDSGFDLFGGSLFGDENDEKYQNINIINTIKKLKGDKND